MDHIWKEKGNHLPLRDEVEMIDREEHWRIRHLKESAHMLGYSDLLSRPNIEMNTIWELATTSKFSTSISSVDSFTADFLALNLVMCLVCVVSNFVSVYCLRYIHIVLAYDTTTRTQFNIQIEGRLPWVRDSICKIPGWPTCNSSSNLSWHIVRITTHDTHKIQLIVQVAPRFC